jgi:hypothetical protein
MLKFLVVAVSGVVLSGCLSSYPITTAALVTHPRSEDHDSSKKVAMNGDFAVHRDVKPAVSVVSAAPLYAVERSCKNGSSAIEGSSYANCMKQEEEAKHHIREEWNSYPVTARAECSGGDGSSYVELLTCFQVKDWKKHPDQIGGVTGTGSLQAKGQSDQVEPATNRAAAEDIKP